jgi:iron complex outermembrane receptor protein
MANNARFALAPLALAIAASGMSAVVSAQERATALEEIIVTAQRRETALQDTPIAITAFSSEKIADLGVYNVSDIEGFAPNTNIRKQPSSNSNMSIYIRGVGSGETSLMVDPKTSFYVDGVYMSKTVGAVFDIVDLERIEVLRGPQGTLFGRNSTGGALNVTTVKPSGEFGLKVEASVGNDGYERLAGSVDLPKMGWVSAKISGILQDYDGWAENEFEGKTTGMASEDNEGYRIALRLEPSDNFTIDYAYDKTDNKGVAAPFQITEVKDNLYNGITETPFPYEILGGQLFQEMAALVGDPDKRRENYNLDFLGEEFLEVEGHSLTAVWETDDITVKYIFADRQTDSGYDATDLDGGALQTSDLFYGGTQVIPTPGFHARIDEGFVDMQTHELQLFGSALDERLQYTVGLFYYDEEVKQDNPQTFALPIAFLASNPSLGPIYEGAGYCTDGVCIGSQRLPFPFPNPGADPNGNGFVDFVYGQETESKAVYGQVSYGLTDDLEITAGLRYTEDERSAYLFNETLGHLSFDDRLTNKGKWDDLSYLLTLNWAMDENINLYLTHSTGYNSGGFNSRASTVSSWESPIDEENISSFELGMKSDWWDNRLRLNAAVFYNEYEDIQTAQFEAGSGGASSRLVNAGEATYQGLELELTALLTDGLTLEMTYGYLDAEFDEYTERDPVTNEEIDISGNTTVSRAPENTANMGLQYDFQPFSWGALSARVDVNYLDDLTFHPFNNRYDSADARTLVNARVSLNDIQVGDFGNLRISAWGKNLTDEEYREWGIDFASLGYAGNTFGQPLTYGIDFVFSTN